MKNGIQARFGILRALIASSLLVSAVASAIQPAQAMRNLASPTATLSLVEDITPGSTGTSTAGDAILGNAVYLSLNDGSHGYELWKSDGTAAGTDIVKDIQAGAGSGFPYNLIALGNHLFFQADDGTNGIEPWVSDGTAAGTRLIHDVNPGSNSSGLYKPILLGTELIFAGADAGNTPPDKGIELWKSSSPFTSAALVKDINTTADGVESSFPDYFSTFANAGYFRASDGIIDDELWKTDGTLAGTILVKDIRADGGSSPFGFTEFNGAFFFQADDGVNGTELWKSDGTTSGTQLLVDIYPGDNGILPVPTPNSSLPSYFTVVGNRMFFVAGDGTHGSELWKTDGSQTGTTLVKDIRDGATSSFLNTDTSFFSVINDQLVFLARDDAHGLELWKSDGSAAGTSLLAELNPSGDTSIYFSTQMNGITYFVADTGDGMEIWQTNGTPQGTIALTNINSAAGTIYGLYPFNGDLLFWYDDGSHGQELWKAVPPQITTTTITADSPDPSVRNQSVLVSVTVTGSKATPTGTVDISGADTNCQIALSAGSGSCNVIFATSGKKTLTATYTGDSSSSPSFDTETHQVITTVLYLSSANQDGWILESGENSNQGSTLDGASTTLRLGDDAGRKQYRSVLSFNTGGLPDNAVITKVLLKVRRQGITGGGNPVNTFQGFIVDIRNGTLGTAPLHITDWQANVNKSSGLFKPAIVGGWYTLDLTSLRPYINKMTTAWGLTQMRLRFKVDDNNDAIANYLSLYSGNAGVASRPQLIVEYYVP